MQGPLWWVFFLTGLAAVAVMVVRYESLPHVLASGMVACACFLMAANDWPGKRYRKERDQK